METDIRTIRNVLLFFLVIAVVTLMKVLSVMVVPLLLALFIAVMLFPVLDLLSRMRFPSWLGMMTTLLIALVALVLVGETLNVSIGQFVEKKGYLNELLGKKLDKYGFALSDINTQVRSYVSDYDFSSFLSMLGSQITTLLGSSFSVIIYLVVILGGLLQYKDYFEGVEQKENGTMMQVFEEVKSAITVYMGIKFVMSLITGICFAIVCWSFGVEFAFFWGFVAFCLNFIPTIGSIIATIPCVIFGFLFLEITPLVIFSIILITVQMLMGNLVEPKFLDKKLAINVLTILIGLVFWGYILGLVGALLSVPLMVLTKLVLKRISGAETLARLL